MKSRLISTLLAAVVLTVTLVHPMSRAASQAETQTTLTPESAIPPTGMGAASGPVGYLPLIPRTKEVEYDPKAWSMAGANPQRTSWVEEEVRGRLRPQWVRPIEPFIPNRFQIIASAGRIYLSTARGVYAFDADNGDQLWVYPTEVPLGNSPTYYQGVLYVGGLDKKVHAVDAASGAGLWTYESSAGFDTNPLVVEDRVVLGSRDGTVIALGVKGDKAGQLLWEYKAGGAVHYSAAYQDGVVYFAADDGRAYALSLYTGAQLWRSDVLPGYGFHSWWPVVYGETLVLAGSSSYRANTPPGDGLPQRLLEFNCMFPTKPAAGTLIGSRQSDGWLKATRASDCIEQYPYRRTSFVLSRASGKEISFDFDNDGKKDYAPITWFGTYSGNRYPPVVGQNGVVYQAMSYMAGSSGIRGQVAGWKYGTNLVSTPSSAPLADDEPVAYSAGGNVIYYTHCCDRSSGGFDYTVTNGTTNDPNREWRYFSYNLSELVPNYNRMFYSTDIDTVYGGANGVYGLHGDQNPPIPYRGKVYMVHSNALIAFSTTTAAAVSLPVAATVSTREAVQVNEDLLRQNLVNEVQKILDAGHLRPGYGKSGNFDRVGRSGCGDLIMDYWHEPSDVIYTLLTALPQLPAEMQDPVKAYIQSEFAAYPPDRYAQIGWQTGAAREPFVLPPDIVSAMSGMPATANTAGFKGYDFPPHMFYTLWKYAETFGGAKELFDRSAARLEPAPSDAALARNPFVHNSFIAGYTGYLELQKLAGYPETASVRSELNRLLRLRASNFSKDSPFGAKKCDPASIDVDCYCKVTNVSRNFMFITPELGDYLRANARTRVQAAVDEYNRVAPYWFVSNFEQTYAEGVSQPINDSYSNFQARALILGQDRGELIKYLDAPSTAVGDLYYIQNLVALLNAP